MNVGSLFFCLFTGRKDMSDKKYEQRKKMIYDFMCDSMYVPMKIKELAIVLGVKKE